MIDSRFAYVQLLGAFSAGCFFFCAPNSETRAGNPPIVDATPKVTLGPWAGDLPVGPGMNAVGRQLKGSRFVGQDLEGAKFDGCDLDGVEFLECDLSKASFVGSWLSSAQILDCYLTDAIFAEARVNAMTVGGEQLNEEQVKSTHSYKSRNLSKCYITRYDRLRVLHEERASYDVRYDFREANLEGARLFGDFTASDFTDARISGGEFNACRVSADQIASTRNFKDKRLEKVLFVWDGSSRPTSIAGRLDLSGFDLSGSTFRNVSLDANFSNATISRCTFEASITCDQLTSTKNYREGNMAGIELRRMDLSKCDFSRQNLTGTTFAICDLTDAIFDDAVITDADFGRDHDPSRSLLQANRGLTVEQIQSTWNYKHKRMAGIKFPEEFEEKLKAAPPAAEPTKR